MRHERRFQLRKQQCGGIRMVRLGEGLQRRNHSKVV
nr:MAG TPA_asm: hypothetical protein [Caudoviricetes sp.]